MRTLKLNNIKKSRHSKDSRKSRHSRKSKKTKHSRKCLHVPSMKKIQSNTGKYVPDVLLRTRVRDPRMLKSKDMKKRQNPFRWKNINSRNLFKNKKVIVFSLPGAYTPTCSSTHLPGYEKKYDQLKKIGVDEVYCMSVNDAFVMHNWGKKMKVKKVKLIPDGNGDFTRKMGALVKKNNLGFGDRSWRYSMYVDNGKIKKIFCENGCQNNCKTDPFKVSDIDTMMHFLKKSA